VRFKLTASRRSPSPGVAVIAGFYVSLIASAKRLSADQRAVVERSADVLRERGFANEAWMLLHVAVLRAEDHWLNAAVAKESAYAATNSPFAIITIYPDFFTYPEDDIERAAILLHEARHLLGDDEREAYRFVWLNRAKLGWIGRGHGDSPVWQNTRQLTREIAPELFNCPGHVYNDCTEADYLSRPDPF
jgi:hypothetical protein